MACDRVFPLLCEYDCPTTGFGNVSFSDGTLTSLPAFNTSSVQNSPSGGAGTVNDVPVVSYFTPPAGHQYATSFVFGGGALPSAGAANMSIEPSAIAAAPISLRVFISSPWE